jgi:hypothetical protein
MLTGNNRGIVTILDVTPRAVSMEQLSKHVSAEKIHATIEKLCFCAVGAEGL